MLLDVIDCPDWNAGRCSRPESVALYGVRPSPGTCANPVACGRGRLTGETVTVPDPVPPRAWSSPATWARFHRFALRLERRGDARRFPRYVLGFQKRVTCVECRDHFDPWVIQNPPPTDPAEVFAYTYRAHQAVSDRIGKPTPTLDDARAFWSG